MSVNYAAIPPLVSHRAPDIPYWATAGGGGGGGSGSFSNLNVASNATVGGTITCGALSSLTTLKCTAGVFASAFVTSTFQFTAAPNTSTLLLSVSNPGIYCWNAVGASGDPPGTTSLGGSAASLDAVAGFLLPPSFNAFTRSANLATTNFDPVVGFTSSYPAPGAPGPVEFYYVNNSGSINPTVTASVSQLG